MIIFGLQEQFVALPGCDDKPWTKVVVNDLGDGGLCPEGTLDTGDNMCRMSSHVYIYIRVTPRTQDTDAYRGSKEPVFVVTSDILITAVFR